MKKILLILVGGTICTALNEKGTLSITPKAGAVLVENFKKSDSLYADTEIISTENLFILSENMTVEKWNTMIDTYRDYINKDNFDGVIFAHGTDTLAFSAALFAQILANTEIPVFFVSSNKRITVPTANGNENFRAAVECICRGIAPNVYVTYKNISDGRMYLHSGSRLTQCPNYSEDFESVGEIDITDINDSNCAEYFENLKIYNKSVIDVMGNWRLKNNVLKLNPYVGINYSAFNYNKFKAVLHGAYHSGTACAQKTEVCDQYDESSILYMIDRCKESGIDAYFSPSKPEGEVYDTVRIIDEHGGIEFLYGTTDETAYAKLLLAYSLFEDKRQIKEFLKTENNGEFIF